MLAIVMLSATAHSVIFNLVKFIDKPFSGSTWVSSSPVRKYHIAVKLGDRGYDKPRNTKGGSITVLLTSCLTGLD
jgi:hypothetical protein